MTAAPDSTESLPRCPECGYCIATDSPRCPECGVLLAEAEHRWRTSRRADLDSADRTAALVELLALLLGWLMILAGAVMRISTWRDGSQMLPRHPSGPLHSGDAVLWMITVGVLVRLRLDERRLQLWLPVIGGIWLILGILALLIP